MTNLDCSLKSRSMKLCARGVSAICVSFFITVTTGRIPRGGQSPARVCVIGRNYSATTNAWDLASDQTSWSSVKTSIFLICLEFRTSSGGRVLLVGYNDTAVALSVAIQSLTVSALLSGWWLLEGYHFPGGACVTLGWLLTMNFFLIWAF